MNWKKGLTIGLLTITAIGLVGCAVILSKKNQSYKPKVQTNAEYNFYDVQYNNKKINYYSIYGESADDLTDKVQYDLNITYENNIYVIEGYLQIHKVNNTTLNPTQSFYNIDISSDYNLNESIQQIYITKDSVIPHTQSVTTLFQYSIRVETNIETYWQTFSFSRSGIFNTTYPTGTIENINIADNIELIQETYDNAYDYGYQTGFTTGYQNKGDLIDGNFIDIRNMMLSVLTMPFTFINQAFDVTLWEGTAYEFNVGNFIKGLIAIASILFIIRLFTSGFSIIGNYTGDIRARNDTSKLRRSQTELNKAKTEKTKNSTTKKE